MSDQVPIKPSDLKSLLKFEGSYNYSLQRFIDIGHFRSALLLQDNALKRNVLGKMVDDFNEGEFIHWPYLRHENVILLLDMVPLMCQKTIFTFNFHEKTLKTVVTDVSFKFHPKCFDRKRSFAKDVLSGLEYLHQKSLKLMNLDGENVLICSQTDKAAISDLSCIVSLKTTTRSNCPIAIPGFFPPEASDENELECTQFDMWNCGLMFLQMFTMYALPRCQIYYFEGLTTELLRHTNPGANLPNGAASNLKNFLVQFFHTDPKLRVSAKCALSSVFLQSSGKRIDEEARDFWKASEIEKLTPDGKFGEVGMYLGTGDIYGKRKDPCHVTSMGMTYFTDLKLNKSNSNNELCTIIRESTAEANSGNEVPSGNRSIENCPLNRLSKQNSNSRENFGDFFGWLYDVNTPIEACNVSKKEKEARSNLELLDDSLVNVSKTSEKMARNVNPQGSSKCYTKEKYSALSDPTFDLPCRCVFCTGTFGEESPLNLIQFWTFPDISTNSSEHSCEQTSSMPFSSTQGGFLHNNWNAKRSHPPTMISHDSIKNNSTKHSNEKELPSSWSIGCSDNATVPELQNTTNEKLAWPRIIENDRRKSEITTQKVYPDNSFITGENQLMFQKCTGFRNGSKIKKPLFNPQPIIASKPPLPIHQNQEQTSGEINKVLSDGRMTHAPDNTTSDERCVKKGKTLTKKKDSGKNAGATKPRAGKETRPENNKVVDIPLELPLCAESSEEKGKSEQVALRNKPKQKWTRVLCPGSFLEGILQA